MTDTTTTKSMEEMVMEIPVEQIVQPTIPVKITIGEAADLHRYATEDKEALVARGLNPELIDELGPRAKFLQDKQSDWNAVYQAAVTNTKEWESKIHEANLLQRELKHDFQFALRNNKEALRKLSNITDGSGNTDLMQDMSDYPKLAAEYPDEFVAIKFDNNKLTRANALSHELYDLRDKIDGAKSGSKRTEKIMRDRSYTYLKQLVDEIRAYGKYAFWDDEKRQKLYSSEYLRIKNNRNNNSDEVEN
ncbi:hypothetical protein [Marinifilum flexuosum]|uniref:hypothetical protein n=1 Tax=Marinifilum flexuosum TaxID=1117708 RepID=UPI0024917FBC|nr:hypothetical protein [Marinifilum flexuosum]